MSLVSRDPNKVTSCHPVARGAWLPIVGDFWYASELPGLVLISFCLVIFIVGVAFLALLLFASAALSIPAKIVIGGR